MVHLTRTKPQGPLCNRHCPASDDDIGDNDENNGDDGGRGDGGLWTKDRYASCNRHSSDDGDDGDGGDDDDG